jgi:dual specificity protein kinase YAK1
MAHPVCTSAAEEQKQNKMNPPPVAQRSMLSALLASQSNPVVQELTTSTADSKEDSLVSASASASPPSLDNSNGKVFNRTTKVAKTKYSDHGAHAIIFNVNEESETSDHGSSDDDSGGDDDAPGDGNGFRHDSSKLLTPQKRTSPGFRTKGKPTSLLHAALTQQGGIAGELAKNSGLEGSKHHKQAPSRGECLTNPSDAMSNDGSDNIEGNLIVHKNDCFKVPNRKVRYQSVESDSFLRNNDPLGVITFQVVGLLGQGTFAQVFQCENLETGKMCAVKIVKNKPAYTRQATIEIEVFKAMMKNNSMGQRLDVTAEDSTVKRNVEDFMVSLLSYFMYKSHLCLVFELLGQNLYELLKQRQFRGLPIRIVKDVVKQAVLGVTELSKRKIVHCDLKPENILLVSEEMGDTLANAKFKVGADETVSKETGNTIKLIDFGSACFEESAGFTYIQSRFYRSPEVLVGVNYDSAIDMWSLGCVAAELFLGLPILPGVNELDQLGRIQEMIGQVPEWMLDQG